MRSEEKRRHKRRIVEFTDHYQKTGAVSDLIARANHYYRTGQLRESLKDYNEAIRKDPDNKDAFYGRAATLLSIGMLDNSQERPRLLRSAQETLERMLEKGMLEGMA